MPTFGRLKAGSFRGGAAKYTRLNLGYRFGTDDVVDIPARAEVTIWRSGRRASPTTDVTLRRTRAFKVTPGTACAWKFGDKAGKVTADKNGLVTIANVPIPTSPTRLIVSKQ